MTNTQQTLVSRVKLKAFPLHSGTRQSFAFLPLLFNIVWDVLATESREGKEKKKRNPDWKRISKILTICK